MLIKQNRFSGFMGFIFFSKSNREMALAYESCAGGSFYSYFDYYLFYILLAGNNEPFRVTPSTSNE